MQSPITGSNNCKLIRTFSVPKIEDQYKTEYSVDVRRFFGDNKEVELFECVDTGYRFYFPFNVFGDGSFYDDLNTNFETYYIKERWEHVQAIAMLNDKMNVLEIGSGDGYFLEMMAKRGIKCIGLELNQAAVEKSIQNKLDVKNIMIEEFASANKSRYDAVCFFQVLEHITDIKSFLNATLECLKPGGLLIIGVPNNNPYIFKHDEWHTLNLPPHHAGLWNKKPFENLVKFFPLTVTKILIEPLYEYKVWFTVQKKYYSEKQKITGLLLSLIPRPLYKSFLKLFSDKIEGRNIFAVYTKKAQ